MFEFRNLETNRERIIKTIIDFGNDKVTKDKILKKSQELGNLYNRELAIISKEIIDYLH